MEKRKIMSQKLKISESTKCRLPTIPISSVVLLVVGDFLVYLQELRELICSHSYHSHNGISSVFFVFPCGRLIHLDLLLISLFLTRLVQNKFFCIYSQLIPSLALARARMVFTQVSIANVTIGLIIVP